MFHYTGEKQDAKVSINDKINNFFNGVKNERAWLWSAAGTAIALIAGGVPAAGVAIGSAASGLLGHLVNYRFLQGKSVPVDAEA
ncbi:hypothetical protein GF389_03865 [Candidatus Dojkabacteria bacterium]|nr:hypothetical protein [Candidatus Dojkabacteria bacterium]